MLLNARLARTQGDFTLDVELEFGGGVLGLFGPLRRRQEQRAVAAGGTDPTRSRPPSSSTGRFWWTLPAACSSRPSVAGSEWSSRTSACSPT